MFVRLVEEVKYDTMIMTLEENTTLLTHDIPTLQMDRIPIEMQEHVVEVPSAWIRLLRKLVRCVICYREVVVEATKALTSPYIYLHHTGL